MPLGPLDYFRVPLVGICCSCFSWLAPATQLGTLALGSRSHAMDTQSPGSPLAGFWLVVVLSQGRTKELKSPRGHRVQQPRFTTSWAGRHRARDSTSLRNQTGNSCLRFLLTGLAIVSAVGEHTGTQNQQLMFPHPTR